MLHFFLGRSETLEYCFNVETSAPLNSDELSILKQLLADGFVSETDLYPTDQHRRTR